jgi:Dullard-like phosphatase family protein
MMYGHSRGLSQSLSSPQSRSHSSGMGSRSHLATLKSTSTGSFAVARGATPVAAAAAPRQALADASFMTQVARDGKPMMSAAAAGRPPSTKPAATAAPTMRASMASTTTPHAVSYGSPSNAGQFMSLLPSHPLAHSRPLLVLDLDETLVHASVEHTAHDVAFNVDLGSQVIPVYVKIRPFARDFLRRVSALFEVAVFTASLAPYADQVVDHLDPSHTLVQHRLYRQHCTNVDGSYIKDLSLLGRSMERVALVDNSPVAYSFHPEHGIPILSWFDDKADTELLNLLPMLELFASSGNIHITNQRFQFRR